LITQDDINHLITAKAGLRTDQDLLIKYFGTDIDQVGTVYLSGAFGNFMNIENAVSIGLLPPIDKCKFRKFSNGALSGARDMLINREKRADANAVVNRIEHLKPNEIEGSDFLYEVADNMYFRKGG
jgi:uncharacterized 2Fe-2S/4Fe-4S cluster protein (DUF4445 family)